MPNFMKLYPIPFDNKVMRYKTTAHWRITESDIFLFKTISDPYDFKLLK